MTTPTTISPADFSDAIATLHSNGVDAVLEEWPALRSHRLLLQTLAEAEQDHTDLEDLLARTAGRVEEAEKALRRAVLEEVAK